jgi:hypothetical protein
MRVILPVVNDRDIVRVNFIKAIGVAAGHENRIGIHRPVDQIG